MSDVAAPLPRIPRWFIAALVLLTALMTVLGIIRSNRSTLRGDEIVTLFWNRRNPSIGEMLQGGARSQVSPAPLYYIIGRAVDDAKERLGYMGLRPSGYFRLPPLLFTAVLGAAAAWMIALRLRRQEGPVSPIAYFLVLCAVAVYWSQPKLFSFACVDRPYALWNGLWLLSLTVLLVRPDEHLAPAIILSLMATTAVPACFQILATAIAFCAVRRLERRPTRTILRDLALIFTLPTLIGAYYALRPSPLESEEAILASDKIPGLLRFWLVTNAHAWIAAAFCLFLVFRKPRLRQYSTPVMAFSLLLLIVPLIFTLAAMKGFSNPSRYYIWTTTALPLALFLAALGWPELTIWKPAPKVAVVLAAGLVLGFSIATFLRAPARNDSRRLACLDRGSPLELQLRQERPEFLSHPGGMGEIERRNIQLLAEWIGIRYHDLPRGSGIAPLRDVNGELISDPILHSPEDLPNDWWPVRTYY
jgi:hypothetical protein